MGLLSRKIQIDNILIVEDEPLIAFDNEYFLKDHGFTIAGTVDRAKDAIAILKKKPVGLVLADVQLTGKRTGIDVAREAFSHHVPVLLMTADCPKEAGLFCVGWIAKPFHHRDLLKAIRAVDRMRRGKKRGRVPNGVTIFDDLEIAAAA